MAKEDKFDLNQCFKNDFEEKEIRKVPSALVVKSLMYTQVYT